MLVSVKKLQKEEKSGDWGEVEGRMERKRIVRVRSLREGDIFFWCCWGREGSLYPRKKYPQKNDDVSSEKKSGHK